ncbi:hypothetical protein HDU91_007045 [Kappamyces sp. JEL0680]|nr:hypothetical protein HDU91_007045 [Kappamyces sp. JEL0680]
MRDERVRPKQFRELVGELSFLVGVVATETLDITTTKEISSPVGPFVGMKLKDSIGIFPILRAGHGMVEAFTNLLPTARIHHLGLFREKLPNECKLDVGFIIDPVIATAGTAIAAVNILKDWGLKRIIFCSLLGSKSGIDALQTEHPDIEIVVGHVDEQLTADGYIYPGCGDAGDRLFKTEY